MPDPANDISGIDLTRIDRQQPRLNRRARPLAGCWRTGVRKAWVGRIPDVADYSSLDGLRSEIAGMAQWSGLSSVTEDRAHTEEGRLRSFVITAESQDAVAVSDDASVLFTPYFSVNLSDANGRTVIQEQILVETRAQPAAPWGEHLRTHRALQDLLSLAYWHP